MNELQLETGLIQNSDVLLDQIRTIDNMRFVQKSGAVENEPGRSKIMENLKVVLDLE